MINLANIGKEKKISFKLSQFQEDYLVSITLPKFDIRKASLGGDWGLDLSIQLEAQNKVHISYKNLQTDNVIESPIESTTLKFEAPMLKRIRTEYPLTLNITDPKMKTYFSLWFSQELAVMKVTSEFIQHIEKNEITHAP